MVGGERGSREEQGPYCPDLTWDGYRNLDLERSLEWLGVLDVRRILQLTLTMQKLSLTSVIPLKAHEEGNGRHEFNSGVMRAGRQVEQSR